MKLQFQNTIYIVLLLITSIQLKAQNWDEYSVVLGEMNWNDSIETKTNGCETMTIRIDGEGNYYPNIVIEDKSLKDSDGKLSEWYNANPCEFENLLKSYNIEKEKNALHLLNQSIENGYVKLIDSLSLNKDIVFLIHGYRKQMYDKKDNVLSTVDNDSVEVYLGNNKLFIEVYWDSKHISIIKGVFGKKVLKMMGESSTPNAKRVGIQLRSLVSSISKSEIAIVCHSLGSVVANELAFNYHSTMNLMNNKHLKIAYLGPAIGYESFHKINHRGLGNYKLEIGIGYNRDDFVLLKKFKKFGVEIDLNTSEFGNTSLGCNFEGDIDKLLKLYRDSLPNEIEPLIIDLSGEAIHHFDYYARHPSFYQIKNFLFAKAIVKP